MRNLKTYLFLLSSLLLSGCFDGEGGEREDDDYGLSASQMTFTAQAGDAAPAAQVLTITSYDDDGDDGMPTASCTPATVLTCTTALPSFTQMTVTVSVPAPDTLGVGTHSGTITLVGDEIYRTIPVTYTITASATRVEYAVPYVVPTNTATDVILRGAGFDPANVPTVTFGGTAGTNVAVVDSNTLSVTAPALTAGTHAVAVTAGATTFDSTASLVVADTPAYAADSIGSLAGSTPAVIYDPERTAIYVATDVGKSTSKIVRYNYSAGAWSTPAAGDQVAITGLQDIALSPDGKTLLAVATGLKVYELDPTQATLSTGMTSVSMLRQTFGDSSELEHVAFANDGRAFITGGTGQVDVYIYTPVDNSYTTVKKLYGTTLLSNNFGLKVWGSAGGNRLAFGETGVTNANLTLLNTETVAKVATVVSATGSVTDVAMDARGTKLLRDTSGLFNGTLQSVANFNLTDAEAAVISSDGTVAYTYDADTTSVRKYDLAQTAGSGLEGADKTTDLSALGGALTVMPGANPAMRLTNDGSALFITGDSAVVVVPTSAL